MRRLPIYILIQTSDAMRGEPMDSAVVGLESLIAFLRQDPFALESVHLSVITFNRTAEQILPLTELDVLQIPTIPQSQATGACLGEALRFICEKVDSEVLRDTPERKGDWKPLLFVICDGQVSDIELFQQVVPIIRQKQFGSIVACLVGNSQVENLKLLTDNIINNMDVPDRKTLHIHEVPGLGGVHRDPASANASDEIILPPPPPNVHTVI